MEIFTGLRTNSDYFCIEYHLFALYNGDGMFTERYEPSLSVANETAVCCKAHHSRITGQLGYGRTLSQNVVFTKMVIVLIFS